MGIKCSTCTRKRFVKIKKSVICREGARSSYKLFNSKENDNINLTFSVEENNDTIITVPSKFLTINDFITKWFSWKDEFFIYMKHIDQAEVNKQTWGTALLNLMGPVGQEIHKTFRFYDDNPEEDIDVLIKKLDIYCLYGNRKRRDDENIDIYINKLKQHAALAQNYDNPANIIKEKIIQDIKTQRFIGEAAYFIERRGTNLISYLRTLDINDVILFWKQCEDLMPQKSCENLMSQKDCENLMLQKRCEDLMPQKSSKNLMQQKRCEDLMPRKDCKDLMPQKSSENLMLQKRCEDLMPQKGSKNLMQQKRCEDLIPQKDCKDLIPQKSNENLMQQKHYKDLMSQKDCKDLIPRKDCKDLMPQKDSENSIQQKRCKDLMSQKGCKDLTSQKDCKDLMLQKNDKGALKQNSSYPINSNMIKCTRCGKKHNQDQCLVWNMQCNICKKFGHLTKNCRLKFINDCINCGTSHIRSRCPAFDKLCTKCGKKNHFTWKCRFSFGNDYLRCSIRRNESAYPTQKRRRRRNRPNHFKEITSVNQLDDKTDN